MHLVQRSEVDVRPDTGNETDAPFNRKMTQICSGVRIDSCARCAGCRVRPFILSSRATDCGSEQRGATFWMGQ